MTDRIRCHRLQVAPVLHRFVEEQVLPGTGVSSACFWQGFDAIAHELGPKNAALLAERDRLQTELDQWHKAHPGPIADMAAYLNDQQMARQYVPERLEIVPEMPRTPSGKVQKFRLREMARD